MKTKLKSILAIALCAVGLSAFAKPAAKLTNGEVTKNYAEEELYQLLVVDGLKDGDKLEFLTDVTVWNSEYTDEVYAFTEGSTITAKVGKDGTVWDIDIAGQNAQIFDSVGTTAGFSKNYEFNNEGAYVQLWASSVAGAFMAPVVEVHWTVEVTGVMKVEDLTFDMESIILKGKGCVYTKSNKLKDSILDQTGNSVEAKDASSILGEGWYVYALDDDPPLPPLPSPPVKVSAVSNVLALDLTAGDRIAADEETLVVDPAWGKATTATVKLQNGWTRTYTCASNDLWDTTALEPGRHGLAFYASADAFYGAFFWKTGADWVVFDSSNITADVTFEAGKTYLFFGTNTVDSATLTVMDGAKFEYDKVAPAGFLGGTVDLPKRYAKETVEGDLYQIVEKIKGCEDNPWEVGGTDGTDDLVTAWTNGTELVISGEGTVTNLADVAKGGIAAVTITEATVTGAAKDAFSGLGGESAVKVTLPDNWQGELPDKDGKLYGMKVDMTSFTYPTAVKNVTFLQRYPWNGLVDITCDLSGEGAVKLQITVLTNGVKLVANPTITGETTIDVGAAGGVKEDVKLIWNAANDLPAGFKAQNVKVKVTVEKLPPPPPTGQLWANGPIWADANLGNSEVKGHPEYGALYKFEDAVNAVALPKDGSRLPTKEEFEKLTDTSVCDQQWDATRKGYLFTGKGDYAASSIFLPAAGFDYGNGSRSSAERTGIYWSCTPDPTDAGCAYTLDFDEGGTEVHCNYECSDGMSVRIVKDAAK